MAEVSPVAKRFGKFTFSVILVTVKDKNYSRNMCSLFCRPTQTRKCFQDVTSWYLLLDLAALNENITFQLRSIVHVLKPHPRRNYFKKSTKKPTKHETEIEKNSTEILICLEILKQ